MTQHELDNAVALATGEPISEISRLGFQAGMLELDDIELEYGGFIALPDPVPNAPTTADSSRSSHH